MKNALIVGMGKSGVASARLLYQNGVGVVIYDKHTHIDGLLDELQDIEYTNALGQDAAAFLGGVDVLVVSPGVPMFLPFIQEAKERGIEVIGEIELGYRFSKGNFLCITGTNGKTTCTALTGEIMKLHNPRTFVLGNIGMPITQFAMQTKAGDCIVAETAALQLEGNMNFHASVAAVTNISEDHLDRFLSMEYYIAVKSMIFLNQTAQDYAVLNYDNKITRAMANKTKAHVVYFSRKSALQEGVYLDGEHIVYSIKGASGRICGVKELIIPGAHNLENAMLSAAIALCAGVSPGLVRQALITFPGVEHRIEFVREVNGVRYINDSKGTNPDSTMMAIAAMNGPTILLLGGYDKHSAFKELFMAIKKSGIVKQVVIMGETAQKLMDAARETGYKNIHVCERSFKEAVDMANGLSLAGDTVLLSPACASWDMFENFEQRGNVFKEIVKAYSE